MTAPVTTLPFKELAAFSFGVEVLELDGVTIEVPVGVGTPEVKGTSLTRVADSKAGDCVSPASVLGSSSVLLGLRTLNYQYKQVTNAIYKVLPINNMNNSVGGDHIGEDNLGPIDKHTTIFNANCQLTTLQRCQLLVIAQVT